MGRLKSFSHAQVHFPHASLHVYNDAWKKRLISGRWKLSQEQLDKRAGPSLAITTHLSEIPGLTPSVQKMQLSSELDEPQTLSTGNSHTQENDRLDV